jgi:hypothetical protein
VRLKNGDPLSNPCSEDDTCDVESDKVEEQISNKVERVKIILNYINLNQIF